jgi:hypothetical protein
MRDVRDYKIKSGGSERLNPASPFNIKARSLTLSHWITANEAMPTNCTSSCFL